MSVTVTRQCHRLAESLADLKAKARAALATELAQAVGAAVRDVLVVALVDRLVVPGRTLPPHAPSSHRTRVWDDEDDRGPGRWDGPRDPWDEDDSFEDRDRAPIRAARDEPNGSESLPAVPVAAAVAAGVNVGRWWLAKRGTTGTAVGLGALATGLGLAGGPVARAALAVLAVAADVLAAESALARTDPS